MKNTQEAGYTYFGVLFVVMLVSLALTGASLIWQVQQQRSKEKQLLFIGKQYMNAISSYYHAAPGGNKRYPRSIEELLKDPRYPNIKRHLKRPWRDPFSQSKEWGLVRTRQGGIAGIYSLSKAKPFKRSGFGSVALERNLADRSSYQEWKFIYIAAAEGTIQASGSSASNTPKSGNNSQDPFTSGDGGMLSPTESLAPTPMSGEANPDEADETGEELLLMQQKEQEKRTGQAAGRNLSRPR